MGCPAAWPCALTRRLEDRRDSEPSTGFFFCQWELESKFKDRTAQTARNLPSQRAPGSRHSPVPAGTQAGPTLADTGCAVLHAQAGGITPGFRMRDAASGTLAGPPAHAELAPKLGLVEARFTPVDIPLAKAAQAALRLSWPQFWPRGTYLTCRIPD
jgi:hypothetical protein